MIHNNFILELDKHLIEFIKSNNTKGYPVRAREIRIEAEKYANSHQNDHLKFSNGWLDNLRKRINLKIGKIRGEGGGVNMETVSSYREKIPQLYLNWADEFIYNCDETGLFWRQFPSKTYFIKGSSVYGDSYSKERVTILLSCNRAGEKVSLFAIGKSEKPRCLQGQKS